MNGGDIERLWRAVSEAREATIRNGEKLDSLVCSVEKMSSSLFGNGQPGLRERIFKIEERFSACRQAHDEEREEIRQASRLTRGTRIAIIVAIVAGAFNLATIAIHAVVGK